MPARVINERAFIDSRASPRKAWNRSLPDREIEQAGNDAQGNSDHPDPVIVTRQIIEVAAQPAAEDLRRSARFDIGDHPRLAGVTSLPVPLQPFAFAFRFGVGVFDEEGERVAGHPGRAKESLGAIGHLHGAATHLEASPARRLVEVVDPDRPPQGPVAALQDGGEPGAVLGLAGGAVAYWSLRRAGQFNIPSIVIWGLLYLAFLAYVVFFG